MRLSQCFIQIPGLGGVCDLAGGRGRDSSTQKFVPVHEVIIGVKRDCVFVPVIFKLPLIAITLVLPNNISQDDKVTISYRLDGKFFSLRWLREKVKKKQSLQRLHLWLAAFRRPRRTTQPLRRRLSEQSNNCTIRHLPAYRPRYQSQKKLKFLHNIRTLRLPIIYLWLIGLEHDILTSTNIQKT